jgi:hypothetical protein
VIVTTPSATSSEWMKKTGIWGKNVVRMKKDEVV